MSRLINFLGLGLISKFGLGSGVTHCLIWILNILKLIPDQVLPGQDVDLWLYVAP